MGRLSATNLTEVSAGSLRRVRLLKMEYPSGTLYLADRAVPGLTYGGQTYIGDGTVIDIGDITETTELAATPFRLRLSAGNTTLATRFRDDDWMFSLVEFAEGYLTPDDVWVDTPESYGSFYMVGGTQAAGVIEQYCESIAIDLDRMSLVTPSDADQKLRYSGDTYYTNVPALDDKEVEWGGKRANARQFPGYGGGNGAGIGSYITGIPGDAIVNNDIAATASPRVHTT